LGLVAYTVQEVISHCATDVDGHRAARWRSCARRPGKGLALTRNPMLRVPPETGFAGFNIRAEVENCLQLARKTEAAATAGDRLAAARGAVELVRAYDRVLEDIRSIALPLQQEKHARDQLAPVTGLLRRYRLR